MALLSGQVSQPARTVRPARSEQIGQVGQAVRAATRPVRRPPSPGPAEQRRHPLVALAMALPVAALLMVLFGGWAEFLAQVSPVLRMFGR
ncbi:hypothetical protein [Phaeacidiphilus oryzae]|jgi:hypothetical protein|uniref:hypothetical protein n=1 Tax=Phaeacidiphilus oryzae TaxID=348818 RepID=UPI000690455E|nr:hypothetical protein [Phaeacidiphilus oryzae]